MLTLLVLAAASVGYLAGRARPACRASRWAWTQVRRTSRSSWRWWAAQLVFAVEIAVLLTTRPRRTVRAWRSRNDPPPPRSPAPRIRRLTEEQP